MRRIDNDGFIVHLAPQPDDRGTIGGLEVRRVLRKGSQAMHFVDEPLEKGTTVQVELDWERRFDHMQQHSGNVGVVSCDYTFIHGFA